MQFYDYKTTRDFTQQIVGQKMDPEAFYNAQYLLALRLNWPACANQMVFEHDWETARRPYYNLYPAIVPMLVRLNLAVDSSFIKPPLPVFVIRLPQGPHPITFVDRGREYHIRSMLVAVSEGLKAPRGLLPGIVIWMDTGERETAPDGSTVPVHTYINLPVTTGMTLEESLHALPYDPTMFRGMVLPEETRTACVRLVCTLCLLDNDPELIEPDVLNRDAGKPMTEAVIDRAKRRGKFGWNIGKGIEVIPHMRRPHPALVWIGHGRTTPRIVFRKGCLVHRDALKRIPTGYQGENYEQGASVTTGH